MSQVIKVNLLNYTRIKGYLIILLLLFQYMPDNSFNKVQVSVSKEETNIYVIMAFILFFKLTSREQLQNLVKSSVGNVA